MRTYFLRLKGKVQYKPYYPDSFFMNLWNIWTTVVFPILVHYLIFHPLYYGSLSIMCVWDQRATFILYLDTQIIFLILIFYMCHGYVMMLPNKYSHRGTMCLDVHITYIYLYFFCIVKCFYFHSYLFILNHTFLCSCCTVHCFCGFTICLIIFPFAICNDKHLHFVKFLYYCINSNIV